MSKGENKTHSKQRMGNGEWRTENRVGGECVQIIPKNDVIEGIKKRRSSLTWPESVNRKRERERNKKKKAM